MHYLEDYLELLEPLREIMREKLTLMRENDLKSQVDFARLEEDSSVFLSNYRLYQKQSLLSPTKSKINTNPQATPNNEPSSALTSEQFAARKEKQMEYDKLIQRHQELLQITNAKIHLANESHEFVERYFKKLENDLHKFKMELEADYAGVTEILERRFANEGCNEYADETCDNGIFDTTLLDIEPLFESYDDLVTSNGLIDDYTNNDLSSQARRLSNGLIPCMLNRKQHPSLHPSSRGRKRSQEVTHTVKRKRPLIPSSFLSDYQYLNPSDGDESTANNYLNLNNSIPLSNAFDDDTGLLTDFPGQLTGTPDERRYCFCNEMSYGDMIACDNRNCRREWFHYSCVGIITPPKGKWFCADCAQIVQQKLQISTAKRAERN